MRKRDKIKPESVEEKEECFKISSTPIIKTCEKKGVDFVEISVKDDGSAHLSRAKSILSGATSLEYLNSDTQAWRIAKIKKNPQAISGVA